MAEKKLTLKQKLGRIKYYVLMWFIELLRHFTNHDLYIIAGQLHTRNTDPLDSWQLFCWLQEQNIPSRYVVNSNDAFYLNKLKGKHEKDLVILNGKGSTTQILQNILIWIHARAFVVEWNLEIPFLNHWLQNLADMRYVMLNHGICALWSDKQFIDGYETFNDINVSSENESKFLSEQMPKELQGRCFVGGLPRFEKLYNEASESGTEKILFVMFTWRNRTGLAWEEFCQSHYWKGIISLLSNENIERFKQHHIRLVVSLHHSLLRTLPNLQFHTNVTVVESKDVRYWISHAHCLLTDFSSVAFDFLYLRKPVLFWIPDANDPSLDPKDLGYGSKVLSAKERQRLFFNSAETIDDIFLMIEHYNQQGYVLEEEKAAVANTWIARKSDFSKHVYEGIESRIGMQN